MTSASPDSFISLVIYILVQQQLIPSPMAALYSRIKVSLSPVIRKKAESEIGLTWRWRLYFFTFLFIQDLKKKRTKRWSVQRRRLRSL